MRADSGGARAREARRSERNEEARPNKASETRPADELYPRIDDGLDRENTNTRSATITGRSDELRAPSASQTQTDAPRRIRRGLSDRPNDAVLSRQLDYRRAVPRDNALPPSSEAATQPAASSAQAVEPAKERSVLDLSPAELNAVPREAKKDFLKQFGIKDKHVDKAKPHQIDESFRRVIDGLRTPGDKKIRLELDKKYDVKLKVGADGEVKEAEAKQKKGFFGKLWSGIKKVGGIALKVASFVPGPIGIAARVANGVIGAVKGIKNGSVFQAVAGAAGAVGGVASSLAKAGIGAASSAVARVSDAVAKGARGLESTLNAVKNGSVSGVLRGVAGVAGAAAGAFGDAAAGVSNTFKNIETWAGRGAAGTSAIEQAKRGDVLGAIGSGAQLGAEVAGAYGNDGASKRLGTVADTARSVDRVVDASKRGDWLGAVGDGAGYFARRSDADSEAHKKLSQVADYGRTGSALKGAISRGDYLGAAESVADFAAARAVDPTSKRRLDNAATVLRGAGDIKGAIDDKDWLAASSSAMRVADELTKSQDVHQAARVINDATSLRDAVKSGNDDAIARAAWDLGQTVKDAAEDVHQRHFEEPKPPPSSLPTTQGLADVLPGTPLNPLSPLPTSAVPTSAVPTSAVPTSAVPTSPSPNLPSIAPGAASKLGSDVAPVDANGRPVPRAGESYQVQRGNTLSSIAQRAYGDANRWPEVYANNKTRLGNDVNQLRTGQTLALPADDFRLSRAQRTAILDRVPPPPSATAGAPGTASDATTTTTTTRPSTSAQGSAAWRAATPEERSLAERLASGTDALARAARHGGVKGSEQALELVKLARELTGKSTRDVDDMLQRASRTGDGVQLVERLASASVKAGQGDHAGAAADVATGLASGWNTLPAQTRDHMAGRVLGALGGTRAWALAQSLRDAIPMGAGAEAMKAVSGALTGDGGSFLDGMRGVIKRAAKDPIAGTRMLTKVGDAMLGVFPDSVKKKLVSKMAGRKIPIIGTIGVGIFDVASIIKDRDLKSVAGLASTIAGAFPGIGTAISVGLDIGIIANEVAGALDQFSAAGARPLTGG